MLLSSIYAHTFGNVFFADDNSNLIRLNLDREPKPFDPDDVDVITSTTEPAKLSPLLYPNPAERIIQVTDQRFDQFELIITNGVAIEGGKIETGKIDLKPRPKAFTLSDSAIAKRR